MDTHIRNFHRIMAGCREGDFSAWEGLVAAYTPLAGRIIRHYLTPDREAAEAFWSQVLQALAAEKAADLERLASQSEREFWVDLREYIFRKGKEILPAAGPEAGDSSLTADLVREVLQELPLLQRELVFLRLAGYSDRTLERLLRINPAVASGGMEKLARRIPGVLAPEGDQMSRPAAWNQLWVEIQGMRRENCLPVRTFARCFDGQISWSDKESMERHLAECLYCFERYLAMKEIMYYLRELPPAPQEEVRRFMDGLPFQAPPRKQSLWSRVLRRQTGSGSRKTNSSVQRLR